MQVDSCSDARRFCSPRDCLTCGQVFFGQMTLKKHGERFLQVFIKLLVETRTKACRTSHSGNSYMKVLVCRNRNSSSSSHKAMRSEILGMNAARKQCGEHTSGNSAHQGTQHSTELSTAGNSAQQSTPAGDRGGLGPAAPHHRIQESLDFLMWSLWSHHIKLVLHKRVRNGVKYINNCARLTKVFD